MTRAPSTLPFELQPDPSPQEIKYQQILSHQRYISSICRSGPIPTSSHKITDPVCMIIYLLILFTTVILFFINYFSRKSMMQVDFGSLNFMEKIMFGLDNSLVQILLSCVTLIAFGAILVLFVIALPYIAGYLIILMCYAVLGVIMYFLINMNSLDVWNSTKISQKKDQMTGIIRISLLIIVGLSILGVIYMNITRFKKLRHLWAMMGIVKVILKSNMPLLPLFILFVLSGFQISLWCGFVKMMWNTILMSHSNNRFPINPTLLLMLETIFWMWTYGIMFSISDYVCQSWVIHWYYKGQVRNNTALKQKWRKTIFGKLFRFHFGTCVFGALISAYLSDFFIWFVRFMINSFISQSRIGRKIYTLSNYCYIQTVMQCQNFCSANEQLYKLRHRISQKLPEVYMLGHFIQKTLQPTLTIATLYVWFAFSHKANKFIQNHLVLDYSIGIFLFMCVIFSLGIFWKISLNISHLFGVISDTAVIVYSIDSQIQRVHFHQNDAHSTPLELRKALRKLQIQINIQQQTAHENINPNTPGSPYPFLDNNTTNLYPRLSSNPVVGQPQV